MGQLGQFVFVVYVLLSFLGGLFTLGGCRAFIFVGRYSYTGDSFARAQ